MTLCGAAESAACADVPWSCCVVPGHSEPAVIFCPCCAFADRQSSNASLETLLALLQTEGAKIEEDTEVMTELPNSATSPLPEPSSVHCSAERVTD